MNDRDKWQAFADADLFIHPSDSENFGISIAEALYAGLPVITTKGAPWEELEMKKCGWWIDLPAEGSNPSTWKELDDALLKAIHLSDDERREMGLRGRKLVEEKYTWDAVVKKMVEGYERVLALSQDVLG
jgi:glycosyltransferase involved in cell wall biosynthesis